MVVQADLDGVHEAADGGATNINASAMMTSG